MKNTQSIIRVRVVPRSSVNQISGIDEDVIKVKLTAPPVEGKANKALVQFLAKTLGVARGDVEILSGERSRVKSIRIYGLSHDDVKERLKG